jgi:predicted RNA-binding Zn-ribbon protein involved in translation (DUF1610 family)
MNSLITLSCPSCGANLEVSSGAKQFSCKYCGNTHVLSDTLPDVSSGNVVCPVDSHQDVILKVSAIIKTQVFKAPADSESEKPTTYKSQLAQKLLCPPKPFSPFAVLMTRSGLAMLIFSIIFLFALLGNMLLSYILPESGLCGFMLFFVIGALVAVPLAKNTLIPVLSKKNEEYQKKVKQWQVLKRRWDNSYYCQRHDIVFVKGYNQTISLDKFQSFLSSEDASSKAHG